MCFEKSSPEVRESVRQVGTGVGKGGVYYFGRLSAVSASSTGMNSRLWSVGEDCGDIWGVWGCPGRDPTLPSHQRLIKVRAGQTATDGDWVVDLEEEIHTGGGGPPHPAPNYHAWRRSSVCSVMRWIVMPYGGLRFPSVMRPPPASQGPAAESAIFLHVRIANLCNVSESSIVILAKMSNILQRWPSYWRSRIYSRSRGANMRTPRLGK